MAKTKMSPMLIENEQIKDIGELAKLLSKLNDMQKAKIEGIAIGMALEQSVKNPA